MPKSLTQLLIPSISPFFLEKGGSWFRENIDQIRNALQTKPWWQTHVLFLEEGQEIKLTEVVNRLADFGYQRVDVPSRPGEFSRRGGFISVFPLYSGHAWQIEFFGNVIERILPSSKPEEEKLPRPKARLGEISRLKAGDYVVHVDHGIGIFRGFASEETLNSKSKIRNGFDKLTVLSGSKDKSQYLNSKSETGFARPASLGEAGEFGASDLNEKTEGFLVIEYAPPRSGSHPDRLLVPIEQIKRVSTYYGFETPIIHRLGTEVWFKTKRKVKDDLIKLAKELLELYAKRQVSERPPYLGDHVLETEFASSFPYPETEDQLKALKAIFKDLEERKPMDRLLIGDVGFGKTEVALRAAFRAILAKKQVCFLAPTTILAWQHFETLKERFAGLPVSIEILTRLENKKQAREILENLSRGKIDILVGTHRILSRDVQFKDLGLLIVDEEQRFGVRQKEKLKNLRPALDILSLSATPIPRTMYLALSGLRGMSIIKTPPEGRLAIQTFVLPYSKKVAREAIAAELKRKGQVYFLHNRVETIEMRARDIKALVPRARVAFIHGRLQEKYLIDSMEKFRRRKIDVLVATTIIENGLDLSNVNTLLIADASRLGLSQAHQLRGRIGRGSRQAFAYFFYSARHLNQNARGRLETLSEITDLGAGYQIAQKDLETRGAGNILGPEQSGAINAVGLNLYMQMLNQTIEELIP